MNIFKKNIWLLFLLLVITSVTLLGARSASRWHEMAAHYELSQKGLVKQWFASWSALLEQHEAIITLIGYDIIERYDREPADVQARLDELMELNPELFSGFALVSPTGEVLELTSNLENDNLPNLLSLPQTRDSFAFALVTDRMVLGRTYYAPRLVVPARKAIRDEDGRVLGVMTGALSVHAKKGFFGRKSVLGPFNQVTILRSRDRYIQYATNGQAISQFHSRQMEPAAYQNLMLALESAADGDPTNLDAAYEPIVFRRNTHTERGYVRGVALYHPRYEFWLISEIEEQHLVGQFRRVLASYLVIMLAFLTGMYLLFRYIDNVDKKRRRELEFQANHDALTQLPNRNFLLKSFLQWKHERSEFSLLFVDLDNFKGINDNFGHSVGDRILVELARRFLALAGHQELVVRHGGDEFVFLTTGNSLDENEKRLSRLIYEACETVPVSERHFSPGCSIGIARLPHHGTELDELLRAADIAMYEAKKKRNSVCLFQPHLEMHYLRQMQIEQFLRGAEKRGEIYLSYQPQVDAAGNLFGVEALARWQSPELGIVAPDQFIGVAESSGQMGPLGAYIIDLALSEICGLRHRCGLDFRLSINISVRQFADDTFVRNLIFKVQESGIPFGRLCLEVTENLVIEDLQRVQGMLGEFHDAGIKIALDDFGKGYSSLSILRHLPLDEIKIDKSFIDDIVTDETALKMVQNIIAIGHNHGMAVLAEGVETSEQLQILKHCGCDYFQGYYFSKPISATSLEAFVSQDY
ncbi:MAG: GGDEF-domain containing protein [Alteromonadaceae bacterium]|mgnify:CR=1 FL=1|nr:GGDEF-domain containing protein [Alteromonadaceae bacterium]